VIPYPFPAGPAKCGFCGEMKGMFVNEYGSTHCTGCKRFFKPGDVVTVRAGEVGAGQTFVIDSTETGPDGLHVLGTRREAHAVYTFNVKASTVDKVPMP